MVEVEIDGKKIAVDRHESVLEAADKVGAHIPHFCYHKKLSLAASCRMCLVEIENMAKPVPACVTPVSQGMVVHTHSHKTKKAQKNVMEFLLINHPLDCPVCDKGGECSLQDIAMGYGAGTSRFQEEKRLVFRQDAGPLISMEEMNRCIHCTRCVRFGQEIAGMMELGMLNRSDHAAIKTFQSKPIESELSGNLVDLCPVGALTSKPFRYQARSWELTSHASISPHDSLGSNLLVQTHQDRVMRVLPNENEAINECWLSDKDRYAYEGLSSEERLTKPMIKQGNEWHETDWQTALEYIAHALQDVKDEYGADHIAALSSPHATLEEMYLLQKLVRGMGSENVDFRLRQSDFDASNACKPWLGMSIQDFGQLENVFVVGSFLRKDHPLLAARLRQSVKKGAVVGMLHAVDDDWRLSVAHKVLRSPAAWVSALQEIMQAVSEITSTALPEGFQASAVSDEAKAVAQQLLTGQKKGIFLGNMAVQHPEYTALHAACEWLSNAVNASFGYLTEGANAVGGYLANAIPNTAENVASIFEKPRKAYVLLHAEPDNDLANPAIAKRALENAASVVVLSPFKHSQSVADVMLPIAPFTETSGTFVNAEGRAQSFQGALNPLGDTRPAWKVLRVLGNLLELPEFDYESTEQIRDIVTGGETNLASRLNNAMGRTPVWQTGRALSLTRVADVPMYFADTLVRRAPSLQLTKEAQAPCAVMHPETLQANGLQEGDTARFTQKDGEAVLAVRADATLPKTVVFISAAHHSTATLGAMAGEIQVEKR